MRPFVCRGRARAKVRLRARRGLALAACVSAALAGCAAPPAPAPAPVVVVEAPPSVPPAPALPPAPPPPSSAELSATAAGTMLAYADRLRTLAVPELTREIARLNETPDSPDKLMQLALALLQSKTVPEGQRAAGLLQRLLATDTPAARPLHPLARQVAAQYAEQRRAEEAQEKQAQQLRDAQRRVDQLSDRLEALRAMERSLPARPTP
jgi:hypothetical protein